MSHQHGARVVHRRTPESAAMVAETKRAMAITARINRLTFDDADQVRALFSELIGKQVDDSFLPILCDRWECNAHRAQRLHQPELHFL